jgi:hypothetical protein
MSVNRFRILLAFVFILAAVTFTCMPTLGEPDTIPSLTDLAKMSDVIVVGEIEIDSGDSQFVLKVARGLKGSISGGQYSLSMPSCGRSGIPSSNGATYGVWFLTRKDGATLGFPRSPRVQVCPTVQSLIALPPGALPGKWSYAPDLTPQDKLAYELAYAVDTSKGNLPELLQINGDAFHGASPMTLLRVMNQLSESADQTAKDIALRGLVGLGDPSAIQAVHRQRRMAPSASTGAAAANNRLAADSIRRITAADDGTINALSAIATDSSVDIQMRVAAAEALRNIHSPLALETLGPMLNDENSLLRDEAIAGIACFANGVPPLNIATGTRSPDLSHPGPFTNAKTLSHFAFGESTIAPREPYFLNYWREWWLEYSSGVLSVSSSVPSP